MSKELEKIIQNKLNQAKQCEFKQDVLNCLTKKLNNKYTLVKDKVFKKELARDLQILE